MLSSLTKHVDFHIHSHGHMLDLICSTGVHITSVPGRLIGVADHKLHKIPYLHLQIQACGSSHLFGTSSNSLPFHLSLSSLALITFCDVLCLYAVYVESWPPNSGTLYFNIFNLFRSSLSTYKTQNHSFFPALSLFFSLQLIFLFIFLHS